MAQLALARRSRNLTSPYHVFFPFQFRYGSKSFYHRKSDCDGILQHSWAFSDQPEACRETLRSRTYGNNAFASQPDSEATWKIHCGMHVGVAKRNKVVRGLHTSWITVPSVDCRAWSTPPFRTVLTYRFTSCSSSLALGRGASAYELFSLITIESAAPS